MSDSIPYGAKKRLTKRQSLAFKACDWATQVVPIFEREYPDDTRPADALAMARRWLVGSATEEECEMAAQAAFAASRELARTGNNAPAYAAEVAAWAAATASEGRPAHLAYLGAFAAFCYALERATP
jgi:hypothetical protein